MRVDKLINIIHRLEILVLAGLLTCLILLSCLQIMLRIFFDSGLSWADPLLRYMVVWSGLLGALLAVSQDKHITIDLSGYLLPKPIKQGMSLLTGLFSGGVSLVLGYASWLFLRSEWEFGGEPFLGIPSWGWNIIFFAVFILMAARYLTSFAAGLYRLLSLEKTEDHSQP